MAGYLYAMRGIDGTTRYGTTRPDRLRDGPYWIVYGDYHPCRQSNTGYEPGPAPSCPLRCTAAQETTMDHNPFLPLPQHDHTCLKCGALIPAGSATTTLCAKCYDPAYDEFASLTLDLAPDDRVHNHDGPPDDSIPTCPVCHYPGWHEDEAYEAQRLRDLARWRERENSLGE